MTRMDQPELACSIAAARRRRRFQWQADVSGPGTAADPMALDPLSPITSSQEASHA
jgi:hypothetical protein